MRKKVIIVHGWDGSPDEGWQPWLRNELENRGYEVVAPKLPNAAHPKLSPWLDTIEKAAGKIDGNTIFVAHSLGCITVIDFLAKRVPMTKIAGAIFVAGFYGETSSPEIAEFYDKSIDIDSVTQRIGKRFVVYSDNDELIDVETSKKFAREISAEEIFLPGKGHFNEDNDVFELPEVLDVVLKI